MSSTIQERFHVRKQRKEAGRIAAIRSFAERREERMVVRKAMRLLSRVAGDERNALELARCVAPGGVFVWPYDPRQLAIVEGKMWSGAKLERAPDGALCMFARAHDDGRAFGDSLYFGIAIALFWGIGEGETAWPNDGFFSDRRMLEASTWERWKSAISNAVKAHCEAGDA